MSSSSTGAIVTFLLVNVFSLLDGICRSGGAFYKLLQACASKTAGRPLRFALYSDEVIPGNVLSARTSRKSWCVYMSCVDFPPQVLAMEEAWLTIALLRSSFVASLEGSISQIFKIIFRSIFLHAKHDPTIGVWMQGPDGGFHLSFMPSMIIQDGAAHKFVWTVKGIVVLSTACSVAISGQTVATKSESPNIPMLTCIWCPMTIFGILGPGSLTSADGVHRKTLDCGSKPQGGHTAQKVSSRSLC